MADPIIARELTSLRDEIAAAQRTRVVPAASAAAAAPLDASKETGGAAPTTDAAKTAKSQTATSETDDEKQLHDLFGELVDEVTGFFEEAEKNIAAHPTASVVGALVVGILIGSMIRRR